MISALVAPARVRGLLEADRHDAGAALRAFDEAAPLAERLHQPLEAARFKAAHGAVLARLGRRTDAAEQEPRRWTSSNGPAPGPISSAPASSSNASAAGSPASRTGELTPSESVVARLVASGLSNRQAPSG